jgi:phosphopentomutase
MKRVILIVLDSVGIGSLPDAGLYGDEGSNTLGHIFEQRPQTQLPNLTALGLGNIDISNTIPKTGSPLAAYGKAAEISAGKDTTTGHWELAGVILENAFPAFPEGFPSYFMDAFETRIGVKTIGNRTASGTEIINVLGDAHYKTGYPIVYTSSDSVFQIAMHEDVIPIERQYEICAIARQMLKKELEVGRVIARPFTGRSGNYTRTSRRKDFALVPPPNVLNALIDSGKEVMAIGKIYDIFAGSGISDSIKTTSNQEGIQATIQCLETFKEGLIFTNLVDFDMLYGHRRDVEGYALCLEEFDQSIPDILSQLNEDDVLIITADHGNDPAWHGTDHTREYVPLLMYSPSFEKTADLGVRNSFADVAVTIAHALGTDFVVDTVEARSLLAGLS